MADKREKMDETQLEAILRHEIDNAIGSDDSELSKRRALAIKYIEGDADIIPHEDGYSSVVSTDVADAIGWIVPSLMRTFASSDNLGEVLASYAEGRGRRTAGQRLHQRKVLGRVRRLSGALQRHHRGAFRSAMDWSRSGGKTRNGTRCLNTPT
jgi:hypothetical protein